MKIMTSFKKKNLPHPRIGTLFSLFSDTVLITALSEPDVWEG